MVIFLASSLAAKSLFESVVKVIKALDNKSKRNYLKAARQELSHIVGRNVDSLSEQEILRATAETASENFVDGVFAPLFWMGAGYFFWTFSPFSPGPLALSWAFKASSTMDSMLGYREGKLKWLGTASARLDDVLTYIPCRLVVFSLPLVSRPFKEFPSLILSSFRDGSRDLSPNSGLSEAIFAHCANVKMGGENIYNRKKVLKPMLAINSNEPSQKGIYKILNIGFRLEVSWLISLFFLSVFFK